MFTPSTRLAAAAQTLTLTLALPGAAMAQDLIPVTFATNWVAQAEHGGYYQALADGTYEDCGLDVTIEPGGPQVTDGRLRLASGKVDFYMGGNMLATWDARKQGLPVKVVAAHFQKEPQVMLTHPGRIAAFEELKDLGPYIIGNVGFVTFFRWLESDFGLAADKRVPYTFNPAAFIADENAAQQGYVTSEPFSIERAAGWAPDVWLLADHGFTTPSTTVETLEATIAERPEVVQCFVDASSIGWANYLYGDPSAGNELIQDANPDISDEQIAYTIEKLKEYGIVDSGIAETAGIGAIDPDRVQGFYDTMVKAGVTDAGLDIAASYTTEFADSGAALAVKAQLTGK